MPLPTLPSVCRFSIKWEPAGGVPFAVNVMHFLDATNSRSLQDVVDDLHGLMSDENEMWSYVSSGYTITSVKAQFLEGSMPFLETNFGGDITGLAGSAGIANTCAIAKLTTNQGGRSGRGRVFMPFVGEGVITEGVLEPSLLSGTADSWNDFRDACFAADLPLQVASYKIPESNPVLAVTVPTIAATQRRRQDRLRS